MCVPVPFQKYLRHLHPPPFHNNPYMYVLGMDHYIFDGDIGNYSTKEKLRVQDKATQNRFQHHF